MKIEHMTTRPDKERPEQSRDLALPTQFLKSITVKILAFFGLLFLCLPLIITPPAHAETKTEAEKQPPSQNLYNPSIERHWQDIKDGKVGNVSIPDKNAALLVQTSGEKWRQFRNNELLIIGAATIGGTILLIAVFYLIRGRIRLKSGMSGETIERFTYLERVMHWTLAISFIILALTGLNLIYGRSLLLPLIGGEAFATLTLAGKWLHNFTGFTFMIALLWTLLSWLHQNLPRRADITWLRQGGGIISSAHPPAHKFNAGQKIIFWLVMLTGISLSVSGLALMYPFEWPLFSATNNILNTVGFNLPTNLAAVEEMQLAQSWHSLLALFMVAVIIAHIYIGTLGMEGAFSAMSSGKVDQNWAREHHSLWVEKLQSKQDKAPDHTPAAE